ncbi:MULTISPECIES: stage V sporulation protein AD [Agathobaculum]|uniref:stage V sporulation protein AD n=1 Tax=Agathobaculum TaxID=2048137 RepID=UPI000B26DEC4|nr:stage V sporulation protein AD [Butyricicoccus sp. BIOML-A1]MCQ5048392.1 stage V sporulation protein AD [Agathobaculum butyriciproducens]MZT27807.1 stage V sporulation protein AD [Butyricicoccus sp. BIOML-A1]
MIKRIGKRTLALENRPYLLGHAAAVGKKEGEGPLGERFDYVAKNDRMGQRSWELAESELQKTAIRLALRKATLPERSLDLILAGDLLNQCIGSFLASMHANVPYLGQYGACSTMAQGLALGGCLVESGAADRLLAAASSHFCSAERQYRFPLAYGGQRTPTAQWTATAAGAAVLGSEPVPNGAEPCDVRVTHVLFGKMVEMGVKDAANMGAAMAPAAADTLSALLEDLGAQPRDFDCIVTGDLGHIGADLLLTLLRGDSIDLSPVYSDCGSLIFGDEQDAHAGGSGCGCSAAVLCGPLLRDMHRGKIHRLVFAGTGAMMSPTSVQQGQPIAGICHAVVLERSEA